MEIALCIIAPNPSPPPPKETIIAGHLCRIWHKSKKTIASDVILMVIAPLILICANHTKLMRPYVSPFRADWNPLSNFFRCTITIQGRDFRSSEHAYQYTKCMFLHNTGLAKVLSAEKIQISEARIETQS